MSELYDGKRGFFANVAVLASGVAIAQLLPVVFAPVLTRLYTQEDFGLMSGFYGAAGILSLFLSLRYDLALMLPRSNYRSADILFTTLLYSGLASLVFQLLLTICKSGLQCKWPFLHHLGHWWPYIPAMALIFAASQMLLAWANRYRRYAVIAYANILGNGIFIALATIIGWLKIPVNGLILGRLVGPLAISLTVILAFGPSVLGYARKYSMSRGIKALARYASFPLLNLPGNLIGILSREFLVLALISFNHLELSGQYALVRTALLYPTSFLSSSLGQVFFREAVESAGTERLERLAFYLWRHIALLGGIALGWLIAWNDVVFPFVFGKDWIEAGKVALALCPSAFMALYTGWADRLFVSSGKQSLLLSIEALGFALKFPVVMSMLYAGFDGYLCILAYVACDVAYRLIYLFGLFHVSGFVKSRILDILIPPLFVLLLCSLINKGLRDLISSSVGFSLLGVMVPMGVALLVIFLNQRKSGIASGAVDLGRSQ